MQPQPVKGTQPTQHASKTHLDLVDVDVEGGAVEAQAQLVRGGKVLVLSPYTMQGNEEMGDVECCIFGTKTSLYKEETVPTDTLYSAQQRAQSYTYLEPLPVAHHRRVILRPALLPSRVLILLSQSQSPFLSLSNPFAPSTLVRRGPGRSCAAVTACWSPVE